MTFCCLPLGSKFGTGKHVIKLVWYGYIAKKNFDGGRGGEGGVQNKLHPQERSLPMCSISHELESVTYSVTAYIYGVPCNTTAMLTHKLTKPAIIISYTALIFESSCSLVGRHTPFTLSAPPPFTLSAPPTNCHEYC